MQLLLTDRLTCPRCGPSFGLILLANRMEDRRVHDGVLGCPNCRDSFPIRDGFADLRGPPRGDLPAGFAGRTSAWGDAPGDEGAREEADRVRALLGIVRGPGTVVLLGVAARHAALLAEAIDELQVVAVDPDLLAWDDAPGVSRVVASPGLPFFSGMLRGAVVDGRLGTEWLTEAARAVAPKSRVVVVEAPVEAARALEDAGLTVLVAEGETVVAARG